MDSSYLLPTLALLCSLVAVFAALYVRSRAARRLLWLVGWSLATLRLVMQILPFGARGIGLAISNSSMELAALMFLGSMSAIQFGRRVKVTYVLVYAAPVVIFSVLTSLYPSPGMFLRIVNVLSTATTVVVALHWSVQKNLLPRWFTLLFTAAVGGACLYLSYVGHYDQVLWLTLSGNSIITALLVLAAYRRLSPGVVFTATGLLIWGLPVILFRTPLATVRAIHLLLPMLNLAKLITAVGMIVLALEDELSANEVSQLRDRRARIEMEEYSKLDVSVTPNQDFGMHYDQVCEVIARASRFGQALIFLRSAERNFRAVGSAGIDGTLVEALDAMGKRLTPEKLNQYVSDRYRTMELKKMAVMDLRALAAPGDAPKHLKDVHAYTIPIKLRTGGLQGALLLSGLRGTPDSLVAEDLLPLELLVARLAAALENSALLRRVVQSEKLAGLGQLAGGVAHELNNPLMVVMGYAELIEDGTTDETIRRSASVIRSESHRMRQTIESLVRFWKSSPTELVPVSIEQILLDIDHLKKPEFERAGIRFEIAIAKGLPRIMANADQMRQIFLQILNNAETAMRTQPEEHEKKIKVEASCVNDHIQVLITDTGPGFPNPTRVFDPFFPIKPQGTGTGLGLSICSSIIREHGGEIFASNLRPYGAAISIQLPTDAPLNEATVSGKVFAL